MVETKICTRCKVDKPFEEFPKDLKLRSGRSSWCRACFSLKTSEYRKLHPGYDSVAKREWVINNRERARCHARKWMAKLYATPKGCINSRISAMVRYSLNGDKRGKSWTSLVGYDGDTLKIHLEKQFKDGMSWGNMGEWHIDHIIPLHVFNYETPDDIDFKRAWALKNLRPLWAKDNQRKSAKIDKPFQPALAIGACA